MSQSAYLSSEFPFRWFVLVANDKVDPLARISLVIIQVFFVGIVMDVSLMLGADALIPRVPCGDSWVAMFTFG